MIEFLQKKGGAVYFGISMLVFLFIVDAGEVKNQFIDIPHIESPILPLYFVIALTLLFLFLLISLKKTKIDSISILLLCPIIIHLTNSIYMGISDQFYVHMATSILSFCVYLITINMNDEVSYLEKAFFLFFVILFVQIVAEANLSGPSKTIYSYKHDMCIPIGASNALSSKILPYFAFLFCVINDKYKKFLLCIAIFWAITLTRSRGGFIDLFVILLILFAIKGKKSFFKVCFFVVASISLVAIFYGFWNSELGSQIFVKNDSTVIGRFGLWEKGLELFCQHPILGNGFYYGTLATNPHNVIVDILMRSGTAGLILFVSIAITLWLKIKGQIANKYIQGGAVALLALFFHGLEEIVFFSYVHEIIIMTFVGYLVKKNELISAEIIYVPCDRQCAAQRDDVRRIHDLGSRYFG